MVSSATKAGVLGLVSLVVPLELDFGSNYSSIGWTGFGYGYQQGFGTYFYNLTQYAPVDEALSALTLVLVLLGAILLLALRRSPKAGASLLLVGLLAYVADTIYVVFTSGFTTFIPLGAVIMLVAAIVGLRAKVPTPMQAVQAMTDSVDRLVKLKVLLDAGAITKEEFEEQKRMILGSGQSAS